ncbi:MAG: right-handed parallel beta-helix repeat-containing protein [Firmicutes bacterium]|nr:right-handed parallel beta-helix repeat-containing protein [Bacillota bacterium]
MKHRFLGAVICGLMAFSAITVCSAAQKGDVDLDGILTASDSTLALQYTLAGDKLGITEEQIKAADYDADNSVTASDAAMILQKVLAPDFDEPENPDKPENPDTSDGVVVTDFAGLKSAIKNKEKKIYIQGTMQCEEQLALSDSSAGMEFYGLTNEDGTGASLDFTKYRDSSSKSGESNTGIYIKGSGYTFKNLFIENAGDCGVRIKGSSAGNCVFENCVFRYNLNSGFSVTSGGHDNKLYNCDSYRNGDIVQKCGNDADGYSVKIGAGGGNYFYNCRAWENSDDGWDSYDRGDLVPDVTYIECLTWHNGNPETFTGEYDYEMGYPLDKKLLYIQAVLKQDPDFEAKYNAHTVTSWPKISYSCIGSTNSYKNLYSYWAGNPNGFKFGSSDSQPSEYRYIENCIAFDHYGNLMNQAQAKGFDQNSDKGNCGMHYDMKNILSFNNVENIQMVKMVADSINGVVWSFDSCIGPDNNEYPDEPSEGMTITEPENKDELRAKVYAYRDMIYDYVYNDKIPGKQICDVFPK